MAWLGTINTHIPMDTLQTAMATARAIPAQSNALVFIAAGTLDDPSWAVPTSHIWVERLSPGVVMQEDAIQVVGQPTDRKILMDAFTKIHGEGA